MNGFKRASRRQAAVVGLAVLMGASFLGCHAGPRLFSKKDRDERAAKRELAEKDKDNSKFINRKKVRPESDYRDSTDEQIAKSESQSKAKPNDTARKSASDSVERALASRQRPVDGSDPSSRSAKSTTSPSKTAKPADRSEVARRDLNQRPVADLLDEDFLFEDQRPEPRSTAKSATASKPSASSTAARSKVLDEDPFKNSVIGPINAARSTKGVATVNFDDEDLDEETEEEADELESLQALTAKKTVAMETIRNPSQNRQASPPIAPGQRKFLEEMDEPAEGSFRSLIREEADEVTEVAIDEPVSRSAVREVKPTADAAKTVAGQKVVDRRQQVQQTLDDWRRQMDHDESLVNSDDEPRLSAPKTSLQVNSSPVARGHISQTSIEEFTPPAKSQGAVLNGELIIDTKALPSRFQRPSEATPEASNSKGTSARVNSNSGANIDIVPGAAQSRPRPAGQISLQSGSEQESTTGLTTAGYEQTSESDLGKLPSLKLEADSETGPKFSTLDDEAHIAPAPPEELPESAIGAGLEVSSPSRVWKRTLLVFAAMASAVVIGFGLRRRMELTPQPIRIPKQPTNDLQDPASWPRG